MQENNSIFGDEKLLHPGLSTAKLENCFTCFRKTDNFLRITEKDNVSGDNLVAIFAQHFWFTKDEYHNRTVCRSCWDRIDDFHRFYCEVEKAYSPPALTEIKLEVELNETNENEPNDLAEIAEFAEDDTNLDVPEQRQDGLCLPVGDDSNPEAPEATDSESEVPLAKRKKRRRSKIKPNQPVPIYTCYYCVKNKAEPVQEFASHLRLKRHSLKVHQKDPVVYCCERRYLTASGFRDHYSKHFIKQEKRACAECKVTFINESNYMNHMMVHHTPEDQKHFKCHLCPKAFAVQQLLDSHLNWHQEVQQRNYHCATCDRYFYSAVFLQVHHETHHGAGDNAATAIDEKQDVRNEMDQEEEDAVASKPRSSPEEIAEQEALIRKFMPFVCPHCDYLGNTFIEFKAHGREKHGLTNFPLTCCQKKFHKRLHMYEHCLIHVNPDQFKCDQCEKLFKDSAGLKHHKYNIHTPVSERPFKCDVCGEAFVKDYSLKGHMTRHFHEAEKKHFCEQCNRGFKTNVLLRNHRQTVHGEASKWVCDICARQFSHRSLLENHRLTHSVEGLATIMKQCEICGIWLNNRKNYLRHKRMRCNSADPVQCKECDYVTSNMTTMRQHVKSKHEERPVLPCSYCGKIFTREIRLKEHEANHAGIMLYKCAYCPKMCNSNTNMYTHKKVAHPVELAAEKARRYAPPTERFNLN